MNTCLSCNTETKNPKFCSHKCSAVYVNTHNHWRKERGILKGLKKCLYCNNVCKSEVNKYCSIACQKEYEMMDAVLHNTASHITTKRALLTIFGNICQVCDISEWNGKKLSVELEHKNGDSTDNSIENVCLICPNCHSQTPTYKAKNWGNGRHNRRKRYKNGLSW